MSSPIGQIVGWVKEKGRQFLSRVIPGGYQSSPEAPTPIYKQLILEHLQHTKSDGDKKHNRSFVRDDNYNNWIDSLYLLKYVLHYLGWSSFMNRVNQVERRRAYPHTDIDSLDLLEQHVKKVLASYEVIDDQDRNEQVVLYSDEMGSKVNPDSWVTTKQADNRAIFFSQSSAQNDSRMLVSQAACPLIREN